MHGEVPQARLRVLGDGPLRPVVQQAVAAGIGVEHVPVSGDDEPAAQFRAGTVYVAAPQVGAARTAASRVRLLQAQASALPIVTTRTGGDRLFVADPPNDLVAQDVGHLAERLIWWLTHPAHATQVGAYNRKRMVRDHEASDQLDLLAQAISLVEESRPTGQASLQDQRSRDEVAAHR